MSRYTAEMKLRTLYKASILFVAASLAGCATNGTTNNTANPGDWDEDPGRFSWEFEVASDIEPHNPASGENTSSPETHSDGKPASEKKPRRVIYSSTDDEDGDRGFVIHSGDEADSDE